MKDDILSLNIVKHLKIIYFRIRKTRINNLMYVKKNASFINIQESYIKRVIRFLIILKSKLSY